MAKSFKFKKSQKIRVIINGVSVYTTPKQIVWGIGDFTKVNVAVSTALLALEAAKTDQAACCGLCGSWLGYQVQIDAL
jgi:hypothetical protein